LSSTENKTPEFLKEHKEILSNPLYQKFIPDYDSWRKKEQEMQLFFWFKERKILLILLRTIYQFAIKFHLAKNKLWRKF
jgi:hypothetical protein